MNRIRSIRHDAERLKYAIANLDRERYRGYISEPEYHYQKSAMMQELRNMLRALEEYETERHREPTLEEKVKKADVALYKKMLTEFVNEN